MAQRSPPPQGPSLGRLIELFVSMGCTLGELPHEITGPDGASWRVRYLYSPETNQFQSLGDLADDEIVSAREVEQWELVLGIEIPKNW